MSPAFRFHSHSHPPPPAHIQDGKVWQRDVVACPAHQRERVHGAVVRVVEQEGRTGGGHGGQVLGPGHAHVRGDVRRVEVWVDRAIPGCTGT